MIRSRLNERLPESLKVGYVTLRLRFSPSFDRTRRLVQQHDEFFHRLFTSGAILLFALMVLMAFSLLARISLIPETGITTLAGSLWGVTPIGFSLTGLLIILTSIVAIIVPHEFGHVIASFVYGAEVEQVGIILLFGFLPVMAYVKNSRDNNGENPHAQLRIAAGGITMQGLLGLVLLPLVILLFGGIPTSGAVAGASYGVAAQLVTVMFYLNIEIAFLNAIPISLLDGGSAYRSLSRIVDQHITQTLEETGVYANMMMAKRAALIFGFAAVFIS